MTEGTQAKCKWDHTNKITHQQTQECDRCWELNRRIQAEPQIAAAMLLAAVGAPEGT